MVDAQFSKWSNLSFFFYYQYYSLLLLSLLLRHRYYFCFYYYYRYYLGRLLNAISLFNLHSVSTGTLQQSLKEHFTTKVHRDSFWMNQVDTIGKKGFNTKRKEIIVANLFELFNIVIVYKVEIKSNYYMRSCYLAWLVIVVLG